MPTIRRMAAFLTSILLIINCLPAFAQGELSFADLPQEIRPGKLVMFSFTAALSEDVDIILADATKNSTVLYEDFPAKAGQNNVSWDGTLDGAAFPPGSYTLQAIAASGQASANITIGSVSPVLENVFPSDTHIAPGTSWSMHIQANMQGSLTVRLEEMDALVYEGQVQEGENDIPWDGTVSGAALAPGDYTLIVQLQDGTGFPSNAHYIPVTVTEAQAAEALAEEAGSTGDAAALPETAAAGDSAFVAPVDFSPYPSNGELNYWTLPMDLSNEAAIWEVMMQPITVLKGYQKNFYKLRAQPDDGAPIVGEITYDSQGVRVLETLDNGWTLIEAYSSSFKGSPSEAWAMLVQGYVKTNLLKTKKPSKEYGLIIDKLTQRLYVFKDGKLFTDLLISTGLWNEKQPYNETQAGEYLIISRVGKIISDNLQGDMSLRFNNGNLIHQVPYTLRGNSSKFFDNTEPKLGTKASHGCVRVQRKKNPEGVNMAWLWENIDLNTKVIIWEDYKGRQIPLPAPDTKLYYNPEGGTYYHSVDNCLDVKEKFLPLTAFNYSQLEEAAFAGLIRCPACAPLMRESEINAVNAAHAE